MQLLTKLLKILKSFIFPKNNFGLTAKELEDQKEKIRLKYYYTIPRLF